MGRGAALLLNPTPGELLRRRRLVGAGLRGGGASGPHPAPARKPLGNCSSQPLLGCRLRGRAVLRSLGGGTGFDHQKGPRIRAREEAGLGAPSWRLGSPERGPHSSGFAVPRGPRGRGGGLAAVALPASAPSARLLPGASVPGHCGIPNRRKAKAGTKDGTVGHLSVGEALQGQGLGWSMLGWRPRTPEVQHLGPK